MFCVVQEWVNLFYRQYELSVIRNDMCTHATFT